MIFFTLIEKTPGNDVHGDAYEYLLNKIAKSGRNGQFCTPRHIVQMMVELMQPQPEDVICESKTRYLIQFNDCPLWGIA